MTANSLPPAGSICLSIHQHHHQTQQHQKNQLVPHDSTLFISESKHVVDVHLDSRLGKAFIMKVSLNILLQMPEAAHSVEIKMSEEIGSWTMACEFEVRLGSCFGWGEYYILWYVKSGFGFLRNLTGNSSYQYMSGKKFNCTSLDL